jgi:acetylornithine deacetylase/succinyl-diaminopimelate desuccinylase-like protein
MALTCGEESGASVNGASWLAQNRRDLIDAAFALNEGAGGDLDAAGKRIVRNVQAGEKSTVGFRWRSPIPAATPRGRCPTTPSTTWPARVDAISRYEFPVQFNDATRAYFTQWPKIAGGETGAAMTALMANPADQRANALLSKNPDYHTYLRTTCVATMIDGGHATNALPQRARANINCRVFPGADTQGVREALVKAIADPAVNVSAPNQRRPLAPAPPMTPQVLAPIEKVAAEMWPGVPVIPYMAAGSTDAGYLNLAGIPTFGVSGIFDEPEGSNAHGLNEHILVKSLMEGREFTYRLVKLYAEQK